MSITLTESAVENEALALVAGLAHSAALFGSEATS